jgi:hypothetical protein
LIETGDRWSYAAVVEVQVGLQLCVGEVIKEPIFTSSPDLCFKDQTPEHYYMPYVNFYLSFAVCDKFEICRYVLNYLVVLIHFDNKRGDYEGENLLD